MSVERTASPPFLLVSSSSLQLSHARVSVESRISAADESALENASIEPRSGERGKIAVAKDKGDRKAIQLSHARVSVESGPFANKLFWRQMLQLSHARVSVERAAR